MALEDQNTLTEQQRIEEFERTVQEQKALLEKANQREKELNAQLAQSVPSTSDNSNPNNGNNSTGPAEVDVRRLLLQPTQPFIIKYSHPIKSGNPEKWIKWYEDATEEIGWNDKKRACNMVIYLDEQASKWYNNSKESEWPNIRQAFIDYFCLQQGERSEFDACKFHPRGNISRFIELKEEKANAAGIIEEEAVQQTVLHGKLPNIFAITLSDNLPKSFAELKRRINRMVTVQQQQPFQESNQYEKNDQQNRQYYRPPSIFRQSLRKAPYPNNRPFNRQSRRPPTPCPNCKKRNIISYHWLSECRNQQNNDGRNAPTDNRVQQRSGNRHIKTFEIQPQNENQDNNQAPN